MYSLMSMRIIASLVVEQEIRERAGELGLAHAGRAEEQETADRPIRVGQPGPAPAHRVGDRGHRLVLADHALVQTVLEADELLDLAFEQTRDGHAGPLRDDLGDVFVVDLFFEHRVVALQLVELARRVLDLGFELGNPAVSDLGRFARDRLRARLGAQAAPAAP